MKVMMLLLVITGFAFGQISWEYAPELLNAIGEAHQELEEIYYTACLGEVNVFGNLVLLDASQLAPIRADCISRFNSLVDAVDAFKSHHLD